MFALQHIYKSFADKTIMDDVSLSVHAGEVIVLIGENGAGKSTLLKTMLGQLHPDSGAVATHREILGYVPQATDTSGSIVDSFEADTEHWKRDYALSLVGLDDTPTSTAVADLSGGQKTRLALAVVLARDPEPTVLLLDEPTNNLDADGLAWLQQFITKYRGGVVLVSHDRTFINTVATSIVELRNGKLKHYSGDYDFYKQQKEIEYQAELHKYEHNIEQRKHLQKAIEAQSNKSQHTHNHIRRSDNDKAQRDFFKNRVTVKLGQNAKMMKGRLEQLEQIERPDTSRGYKLTLNGEVPATKLLIKTTGLSKVYDTRVMTYPDLEIRGSERLHIQGENGSGKTTLLTILAGLTQPDAGEVTIGPNITVGYFSQDITGLDDRLSNFENLEHTGANSSDIYKQARTLGLNQNDMKKKPLELSRGQQAKLSFAKLLLANNQLLVLDEPTNHLDITTRERIEAALQGYRGAIIFASHDMYFAYGLDTTMTLKLVK